MKGFALALTALFAFITAGQCVPPDFARLLEPPPRGALPGGRLPFPEKYEDSEKHPLDLDCGGPEAQQEAGGQCGVCGDPWTDEIKQHESEGAFPESLVIREYTAGDMFVSKVMNGRGLEGYMEYRLCSADSEEVNCEDAPLLNLVESSKTRFQVKKEYQKIKIRLELPVDVSCERCVLQWHYYTTTEDDSCEDCGPLEYYNCADITVLPNEDVQEMVAPQVPAKRKMVQQRAPAKTSSTSNQTGGRPQSNPASSESCHAIGKWAAKGPAMDAWCKEKCSYGHVYCPKGVCGCDEM